MHATSCAKRKFAKYIATCHSGYGYGPSSEPKHESQMLHHFLRNWEVITRDRYVGLRHSIRLLNTISIKDPPNMQTTPTAIHSEPEPVEFDFEVGDLSSKGQHQWYQQNQREAFTPLFS